MLAFTNVGVSQDAHPFGIGSHDSVLDPVMDHLHEMAGAVRSAMEVTLLGSAANFLATWCARNTSRAWRQDSKDRIEVLDDGLFAADHHAVPSIQPPHPSPPSALTLINLFPSQ